MPRKFGIRSLFSHHSSRGHAGAPSSPAHAVAAGRAPPSRTFSATMMADNIAAAEEIVAKWDPKASTFASITSIFYESRAEARLFLRAVADLQRAMSFFMSDSPVSSAALLVRAQSLMQAAMRRLQKEFYQILSANRDRLDPESSVSVSASASARSSLSLGSAASLSDLEDEEFRSASESIGVVERVSDLAMADLRSIAECMISCGYGRECVDIYKTIRRSIVDEGLYKLGFEKITPQQVQKLDWEILDIRIRSWLGASRVAVRTLLSGERALCDHVFASSDTIRQSCFAEITREASVEFFAFPEQVASKKKRSPEGVFRILDMYGTIADLWPEIESVFSYETTSAVRSQASSSLLKLGEVVRSSLADFESAIHKDKSKAAAPGGGLHPLSRYVMNYLALLADYSDLLVDIYADYPFDITTALPKSFFDASPSTSVPSSPSTHHHQEGDNLISSGTTVSVRIAWLVLVLLCKLDSKAELYQEVALAYLFLANNLRYLVRKVRGCKLLELLGEDWTTRHEAKAEGYAASYERLAWSKVLAAVPQGRLALASMDAQAAREQMRRFNEAFEEAYRGQAAWVVSDGKMREELKLSIARKLVPAYREFLERCRALLWGGERLHQQWVSGSYGVFMCLDGPCSPAICRRTRRRQLCRGLQSPVRGGCDLFGWGRGGGRCRGRRAPFRRRFRAIGVRRMSARGGANLVSYLEAEEGHGEGPPPDQAVVVRLHRRRRRAPRSVVEAVRRNPVSVVVLEDVDRANLLVQGSLRTSTARTGISPPPPPRSSRWAAPSPPET